MKIIKLIIEILLLPIGLLFHLFSGTKGNFEFVAKNVVLIYLELKNSYGKLFTSKAQLLAVTGIIDALTYINLGQLNPSEIVALAKEALGDVSKSEDILLRDFIVLLEIELFSIDSREIPYMEIAQICYEKTSDIHEVVKNNLGSNKGNSRITNLVHSFMQQPTNPLLDLVFG